MLVGRHYVAQALAHSDASFRVTRATDCLFDCEPVTREIGITHVSLDQGCVTERVRELAEDSVGREKKLSRSRERQADSGAVARHRLDPSVAGRTVKECPMTK